MKLEIAAGKNPQTDDTWVKHDLNPYSGIELVCDWISIRHNLAFKGVFELEEIYTRHFIEHLDPVEGISFLQECYHLLKEEGKITVVCPNMEWLCKKYIEKGFIDSSEFVCWMFGGGDDANWSYHKSGYDCSLLCHSLKIAGFKIKNYTNIGFHLEVIGVK